MKIKDIISLYKAGLISFDEARRLSGVFDWLQVDAVPGERT